MALDSERARELGRRGGRAKAAAARAARGPTEPLGGGPWTILDFVAPAGESGVLMVVAADRRQARVVLHYLRALFQRPTLHGLLRRQLQESIELRSGVTIEVHTASYRTTRGYTVVAAVLDEVAFWHNSE